VLSNPEPTLGKIYEHIKFKLRFHNFFKAQSPQVNTASTYVLNILLGKFDAWQKLCKLSIITGNFQSTLLAKLYTWEKSSTLKGKCSVNAGNFICNL